MSQISTVNGKKDMPWHPLLVHIPIAFALFSPFVALYFAAYPARRQAFWVLWMILFAAFAYGSMAAGLEDAKTWEDHKDAVAAHRLAAEQFFYSVLVLLALAFTGNKGGRIARLIQLASVGWSVLVLGMCARAAHLGAELVHVIGAGK